MLLFENTQPSWSPFSEMRRLQSEIDQLFDAAWPQARERSTPRALPQTRAYPPVNLWLGDNSVVITAELPGLDTKDVDLTVRENTLTIRGERTASEASNADWHRQERVTGEFTRTIELPFRVDPDRVDARFANGVLEVELQRPEEDKPRKIKINGK
jgi:HSP20 family protein